MPTLMFYYLIDSIVPLLIFRVYAILFLFLNHSQLSRKPICVFIWSNFDNKVSLTDWLTHWLPDWLTVRLTVTPDGKIYRNQVNSWRARSFSVKWPCSPRVLTAQWIECRCLGGHGLDSYQDQELRFFLCPTLVSCWLFHFSHFTELVH